MNILKRFVYMNGIKRISFFCIFLILVLLSVPSFIGAMDNVPTGKSVMLNISSLEFITTGGEKIVLSEVSRKRGPVLVNFWGLRCSSCLEEIPFLNSIAQKYFDKIIVFGINVDGVDNETLQQKIRKQKLEFAYEVVPDPEFLLVDFFRMKTAPLTIIVGKNGDILYRHEGFERGDETRIEENIRLTIGK
jgi:thiol-disulfide isomerase/thioredoxin